MSGLHKVYHRYSPRRNQEECESIEVQAERCESYARHQFGEDVELTAFADPAVSGGTPLAERPEGGRLVASLRRGDILVVQRLDRLFRDAADGIAWVRQWTKRGISLHLADQGGCSIDCSSAVGRFMIGQLLLQAEFEKDLTGEKTSYAMKRHQRAGRAMSAQAPYGFRKVGREEIKDGKMKVVQHLVEDFTEQQVITVVRELHEDGKSNREITRSLEASDFQARSGRWHHVTIGRILKRCQED